MPHFTVLIGPQGPLVQAFIGVSAPRKQALIAAGQPVPPAVIATLLLDTGAYSTSIDSALVGKLGITPTGTAQILTPSTGTAAHTCSTYDIELVIPGPGSSKIVPALAVIDGNYAAQGIDGLLGRDVLQEARVTYSGPDKAVLVSF